MGRFIKWLGVALAVVALLVGAGAWYVFSTAASMLDQSFDLKGDGRVPVPFPLTSGELAELQTDPETAIDADAVALERAVQRGQRIANTRAGCGECHGADGGGGVIVDAQPMGRWMAPSITGRRLTTAQWDLAVRHGVASDGTRSTMPSDDYATWADRDLSDLIAYYRSLPEVDHELPPTEPGPIMAMLVVQGLFAASVDRIDHKLDPPRLPPEPSSDAAFGAYIGSVCTGCHGPELSGGAIPGADPSWPEATNLTPHATGTQGWTLDTFSAALRAGTASDGHTLHQTAMPWPVFNGLSDLEVEALFAWTQSLAAKPAGGR